MSPNRATPYWEWIALEARSIGSDGCTFVSEWNQPCCFEHDLACHYGKDPRVAYALWVDKTPDPWGIAQRMSRRQADKMFRTCNAEDALLWGRIRSFARYLGVRLGDFFGIGGHPFYVEVDARVNPGSDRPPTDEDWDRQAQDP